MRLGIITDVHEHVEHLDQALRRLRSERVDQIVSIGDVFGSGRQIETTCRLLAEAGAVGVWGNHDFGLCGEVDEDVRPGFSRHVLDFMGLLQPRLVMHDCHFCHIDPWLDPHDIADLWSRNGPPISPNQRQRIFDSAPQRILFGGHYHHWLLATANGISSWAGEEPISLAGERFYVVVHALCEGHFAIFDTDTEMLTPLRTNPA